MPTVALFVTLLLLISLFALLFVCYQQQQRGREMRLAQEAAAATAAASANHRAAAIIFSSPVGHYPDASNLFERQLYPPQLRLASARAAQQQQPAEPASFARFYNKKTPTPRVIIDNLPVVEFQAAGLRRPAPAARAAAAAAAGGTDDAAPAKDTGSAGDDDDDAPQCVICCCAYQQGELVKLLPCLHSMHAECIDLWLERDHTCPICQADIVLAAGLSMDWSAHPLESINALSGGDHAPAPAAEPAAAPAVPAAAAGAGRDAPPALPVSSSSSYAGNAAAAPTWTASSTRSPARPVPAPQQHAAAALYVIQPTHSGSNSLAAGLPGS